VNNEKNKLANKKLIYDTFEKEDSVYKKCFSAEYAGEEVANYFKEELGKPDDGDYGLYSLTHDHEDEFLVHFNAFKEKLDAFITLKEKIEEKYNGLKDGFDKLGNDYEAKINNLKSKTEIEKDEYKQAVDSLELEFLADLIKARQILTAEKHKKENQEMLNKLMELKSDFEKKYKHLPVKLEQELNKLSVDNMLKENPTVYRPRFLALKNDIEGKMAEEKIKAEKISDEEKEKNKNANKDKLSAKENEWKKIVADYMEIEAISSQINELKKDGRLYTKPEDYNNSIAVIDLLIQNESKTRQKKLDNKTKNLEILKKFKTEIDGHIKRF